MGKFDYLIDKIKSRTPEQVRASLIEIGVLDKDGNLTPKYQTTPEEEFDAKCMYMGEDVDINPDSVGLQ